MPKPKRQPYTKKAVGRALTNAAHAIDAQMAIHPIIADALHLPSQLQAGPAKNMWNTAVAIHNKIGPKYPNPINVAQSQYGTHVIKRMNAKSKSNTIKKLPKTSPRVKSAKGRKK